MPQLNLYFTNLPLPETSLWEQLDQQQKQIVLEVLARLIAQAARANHHQEQTND